MKRSHAALERASESSGESNDDGYDDGEDLMARAASMMDFDDEGDSEDDDDTEASEAGTSEAGPSNGKKQKLNNKQKRGKKHEESNGLPEDEEAEVQSVLQLQIDALLSSVRVPDPSSSKARPLNNFVERLRVSMGNAASRSPLPAHEAVSKLKAPLPFSDGTTDLKNVKWQLAFQKPSKIEIGGSWPVGTACRWKGQAGWNVDVLVQMPGGLFQEKDVKDSRYFYKRAYFLSALKEHLEASGLCESVSVAYLQNNRRKPILEVTATSNEADLNYAKLRCVVRVIPVFEWTDCPFHAASLGPARNNLRSSSSSDESRLRNPVYNADLAFDGSAVPTMQYMDRIAKRSDAFAQAALLLKTWALQRGLTREYGLSHCLYLLSLLLAYVFDGTCKAVRAVPAGSGSWQAFRACLDSLARIDFENMKLISFTFLRHDKAPTVTDWQSIPGPVLTDPTGLSNILAETPLSALAMLRYEANLTLRRLRANSDAFDQVLLRAVDHSYLRFDQVAKIELSLESLQHESISDYSSRSTSLLSKLATVLKQGLGNRARAISLVCQPPHNSDSGSLALHLGLYLEPVQIQRMVEYGPAADDKDAVLKFRALWGSKAETRKFRDGRILECVVWNAEGPEQRSKIFVHLIQHLLSYHFGMSVSSTHFFASAYDKLLAEAPQIRKALYTADPQETGFSPLTSAFDYLVKELKELKDLPLKITNVVPVSEGLRYTTIFVPGGAKVKGLPYISTSANYLALHECHLIFEGSGKWPEDLEAIQKIKGAFLARLAQSLARAVPGCRCELQYDLPSDAVTDYCSLAIVLPSGFAFRLRIHHDRERTLMEDTLLDDELDDKDRKKKQTALLKHHQIFVAQPDHHGAIAALQQRHASYSTTVRITKRWIAAHCLAVHVPMELIELIAAHVYLDAESPYEAPATGATGFARVLHFLSEWRWRDQPLLVPVYTAPNVHEPGALPTFPPRQKQGVLRVFAALRKADPTLSRSAWFIATEKDTSGRSWGENSPSRLVAGRVQELARACLQALKTNMSIGDPRVQHLFLPDYSAFDFILHLNPSRVSNHMQAIVPSNIDLAKRPDAPQIIRPGHNAVLSYIHRLQAVSGDIAVLFYDSCGGLAIGGLFNPTLAGKERVFRIAIDFPTYPAVAATEKPISDRSTKQNIKLDRDVFLQSLFSMGDGLVEKVTRKE